MVWAHCTEVSTITSLVQSSNQAKSIMHNFQAEPLLLGLFRDLNQPFLLAAC